MSKFSICSGSEGSKADWYCYSREIRKELAISNKRITTKCRAIAANLCLLPDLGRVQIFNPHLSQVCNHHQIAFGTEGGFDHVG